MELPPLSVSRFEAKICSLELLSQDLHHIDLRMREEQLFGACEESLRHFVGHGMLAKLEPALGDSLGGAPQNSRDAHLKLFHQAL